MPLVLGAKKPLRQDDQGHLLPEVMPLVPGAEAQRVILRSARMVRVAARMVQVVARGSISRPFL